ncbi:MAG: hypothetical protein J0H88_08405 [Sphingomonadales bacterium]|nr:hypothetical protein [Sphingomonadales bacterium]
MSGTPERQQVIDWLTGTIEGVVGPDGEFEINPSGEPASFPAIYAEESDQSADDTTEPGATRYELEFGLEGYVSGGSGIEATTARSELYDALITAILDATSWPDCIEEIHEGDMRLSTATLAAARRLGFNLTVTIHFVAPR